MNPRRLASGADGPAPVRPSRTVSGPRGRACRGRRQAPPRALALCGPADPALFNVCPSRCPSGRAGGTVGDGTVAGARVHGVALGPLPTAGRPARYRM